MLNLEALDRRQIRFELELGQDNDLIAAPRRSVRNDYESVDVTERHEAQLNLGEDAALFSCYRLVRSVLQDVRNDIPVRYHDCFLQQKFSFHGPGMNVEVFLLTGNPEVPLE